MTGDWLEKLTAQGLVYHYLSKAFYEAPSLELIQTLVRNHLFADWPMPTERAEMQEGLSMLQTFCGQWDDSQIDSLRQDYQRLFIGPNRLLAPPWESVYRTDDHLLFGQSTLEVREMYARFGLQTPKLNSEPDDHIGLEFTFLAHLCQRGIAAIETHDTIALNYIFYAQREFLTDHLLQWMPAFCTRVCEGAETLYYCGIARLSLGCLLESVLWLEPVVP
jgi:TorA maturation chaperone TorD